MCLRLQAFTIKEESMGQRRDQLNAFYAGMKRLNQSYPSQISGFNTLLKTAVDGGALDFKTKELTSVAVACYTKCEYCIAYHVYTALKAGASAQEVMEAGLVSVVFGGGPAMAYIATCLQECIDEFQDDFGDKA
jgi:AhpD family alkylhydroperoxidase